MTRRTVMWLRIVTFFTAFLIGCLANQSTVETFIGMNVLLPCSCGENEARIVWQKEPTQDTGTPLVCHEYSSHKDSAGDSQFTNRTRLLRSERGNCSLELFGVTLADQGQYTCYTFNPLRKRQTINLKVMANYSASCTRSPGDLVCVASGGYPEGKIYWQLAGQRISNQSATFKSHMDPSSLLYNLTSNLTGSRLQHAECVLEMPGQTITINCAEAINSPITGERNDGVTIGVPVILILIVVLAVGVLYVYCRQHRTLESTSETGCGNGNESNGTEESLLKEVVGKDPVQTEFTIERET
ncbi:ICOS ligand-like [Sardina pilchardus]|uniref:ICOS ligand-like n=1 Tax=Sardina pilchardus TaxID=27697 RepID=UPI002E147956